MTQQNLLTFLRWCSLRLTKHLHRQKVVTIEAFFIVAFTVKYGKEMTPEMLSQRNSCLMLYKETGLVPDFVSEYIRHLYSDFTV